MTKRRFGGTVKLLELGAQIDDPEEWRRKAARVAWCMATLARWRAALDHQMKHCMDSVEKLDDEAFERLCDEEQAKVDAIRAELDAVIEHDRWPAHLYWTAI